MTQMSPLLRPGEKNSTQLNEVIQRYQKGDYRRALKLSNVIYMNDACHVDNLLLLGAIHLQLQNIEVSVFYCQQCMTVDSTCAEALNILGLCSLQQGDVNGALVFFSKATKINPRLTEAYSNLAMTYVKLDQVDQAFEALEVALTLNKANVEVLCNYGLICKLKKRFDQAKKHLLQALKLRPRFPIAWLTLGNVYYDEQDYKRAQECFNKAINTVSGKTFYDAEVNLANALLQEYLMERDELLLRRSIKYYQQNIQIGLATSNLGVAYSLSNETKNVSLQFLRRNVHDHDGMVVRLNNLGLYYLNEGNTVNAKKYFVKAIRVSVFFSDAWNNLGCALAKENKFLNAMLCFCNAITNGQKIDYMVINMSIVLCKMGCSKVALQCYKIFGIDFKNICSTPRISNKFRVGVGYGKSSSIRDFVDSNHSSFMDFQSCKVAAMSEMKDVALKYFSDCLVNEYSSSNMLQNIGMLFVEVGMFDDALACFQLIQRLNMCCPSAVLYGSLYAAASICDWELVKVTQHLIEPVLECNQFCRSLLSNMIMDLPYVLTLRSKLSLSPLIPPMKRMASTRNYPIRIGYISSFFGDNSFGHFISGFVKHHDRSKFVVYCYSSTLNDSSQWFDDVKGASDHWYESANNLFDTIAQILKDRIDVLIGMSPMYDDVLENIFSLQIAPFQILSGLSNSVFNSQNCQFVVGYNNGKNETFQNPNTLPKLIAIPSLFILNHYNNFSTGHNSFHNGIERSNFGIHDDAFVFAFCHNADELTEEFLEAMLKILARTPASILWFYSISSPIVESKVFSRAQFRGIEPNRLIFSARAPCQNQIKRLNLIDLILYFGDSLELCCDALRLGRPMISLHGTTATERIGVTLLDTIGLSEIVVGSVNRLVDLAISLANCDSKYIDIIKKFEAIKDNCDLFDDVGWIEKFEHNLMNDINQT